MLNGEEKCNRIQTNTLIRLFACTYMVSYLTRINYGTIISAMVE